MGDKYGQHLFDTPLYTKVRDKRLGSKKKVASIAGADLHSLNQGTLLI